MSNYHRDAENNLKYLYDYDSLGRLIRQEIQTNDTFAHVGSTEVAYDIRNNVTKVASEFGGYTAVDEYLYSENSGAANAAASAQDNLISRYKIAGSNTRVVDYSYDDLNRLKQKKLTTTTPIYITYEYKASDLGGKYTTTQLETEKLDNTTYKYYYDKVGNITGIDKNSGSYRSYTYDNKNQLLSETITKKDANNNNITTTTSFTYDAIGNISKKVENDGTTTTTINYRYDKNGKTGWNNLLTGVDFSGNGTYETVETISYDNIGNPTTYLGASLSWYGRQLTSYTVEDDTNTTANETLKVTYTYDAEGLRGTKTVTKNNVDTKHTYHYVSGQLRYETRGNLKFYYFYDASGNLSAIRYYPANSTDGYMYYPLTNSRGDVVTIYNSSGTPVVTYEYDAWGNCTIVSDTSGRNIGELNPIRYRGYYYDTETGLYYLQSRYYNPNVGRFVNTDSQISGLGDDVLGYNLFAYCKSNPVNACDPTGHWSKKSENLAFFAGCIAVAGSIIATVAALVTAPPLLPVTIGLLSVSVASMEDGIASMQSGNSFSNAYTGGVISNTIEQVVSHYSKGNPGVTSIANGLGTMLGTVATTHLNNLDPYSKDTPSNEIGAKMIKNASISSFTSFCTGIVYSGVDMADSGQCYMENYTSNFGFGLKVLFSILDDTINIIYGE